MEGPNCSEILGKASGDSLLLKDFFSPQSSLPPVQKPDAQHKFSQCQGAHTGEGPPHAPEDENILPKRGAEEIDFCWPRLRSLVCTLIGTSFACPDRRGKYDRGGAIGPPHHNENDDRGGGDLHRRLH